MKTIEERANKLYPIAKEDWDDTIAWTTMADILEDKQEAYIKGATEQQKIDEIKYNKLKELAMDMYTAMQYLSTDTRSIREKMEKFHHFIIYESKAMEE